MAFARVVADVTALLLSKFSDRLAVVSRRTEEGMHLELVIV